MSVPNPCSIPQPLKNNSKLNPKPQAVKNFPTFILDHNNVKNLFNSNELIKKTIKNTNVTHKFIIQNTKPPSSKINILKAFVKQAKPHLIVPMDISTNGQTIEFYCKSCEAAVNKFCATDNLMLTCMTKNESIQVPMTLIVGYKTTQEFDAREIIRELLKSRITTSPVTVNLQNCDTLPGMCKKIYFDISFPLTLNFVVGSVRSLAPKVIILSHNKIETVRKWKRPVLIESIDLSFNQIKSLEELGPLLRMELQEIDLRGNPVCHNFASKTDYLQRVKELFPTIKTIDLIPIDTVELEIQKNYFPTSDAAEYLVDQFMEHYFTLYDNQKKRRYLQDIYHRDAFFTLTSSIVDESGLSPASQRYKHHAHNLLYPKSPTDFSIGPAEIIRKICYLPQIEHDPRSFSVDILHYAENKSIMFIVYGVCREVTSQKNCVLYSFSRTFMLLAGVGGEFQIINDMLYVTNRQFEFLQGIKPFKESFRYREEIEINRTLPVAISKEEKDGFLAIFIELTLLHVNEANDFLEKSKWNMREALEIFIHEYRFDQIDPDCFIHEEIMRVVDKELPSIHPGMNKKKLGTVLENMRTLKNGGYFIKPPGIRKQAWRRQMQTLKQLLAKEN